jgi:hypothetical protein
MSLRRELLLLGVEEGLLSTGGDDGMEIGKRPMGPWLSNEKPRMASGVTIGESGSKYLKTSGGGYGGGL